MSDEISTTIELPRRKVERIKGLYFVCQYTDDCGWIADGRGYPHSTSAYAKLGRLVNQETLAEESKHHDTV